MSPALVLCYHALSPAWPAGLSVTPESFERQIAGLVRRGWTSATFTELSRASVAPKTMAITFDDAFASVRTYALPVLSKLGVKATVFAPTDYISRRAALAWAGLEHWQQTDHAHELTPLSWDDLGEMADLGWEIGSHSRSHPMLTSLDDQALAVELRESRADCAQQIGRPVTALAYPYGDVDERVADQARQAGYLAAAALAWPTLELDLHQYPRIGVYHKDSWPRFRLKIGRWPRSMYGSKLLARRAGAVPRRPVQW